MSSLASLVLPSPRNVLSYPPLFDIVIESSPTTTGNQSFSPSLESAKRFSCDLLLTYTDPSTEGIRFEPLALMEVEALVLG